MEKETIVGELKEVEDHSFRFRQSLNGQFNSDFIVNLPKWLFLGQDDDMAVKNVVIASLIQMAAIFPKATIITNFHVPEDAERYWAEYAFAQHKQNSFNLGKEIVTREIDWKTIGDAYLSGKSREDTYEALDRYKVLTGMSGGKDSLLQYFLLEEIGEEPFNFTVQWATIACARGINRYIKDYFGKVGIHTHLAWNNTNQRQGKAYADILKRRYGINADLNLRDDSFTSQVSMLYEDLYCLEQCLIAGIMAQHLPNVKWIIAGDEFTDNNLYRGHVFNPDTAQSWLSKILLSKIYKACGLKQRFGTVIYNLEFPAEYLLIEKRYKERSWILSSCISNFDGVGNRWCHKCGKDLWAYLIWKALGIDPEYYGLHEELLFKKHHAFHGKFFGTGDTNFGGYSEDAYILRVIDEKYGSWIKYKLLKQDNLPKPLIEFLFRNLLYEPSLEYEEAITKAGKNLAYTIPEEFRDKILKIEEETIGLTNYENSLEREEVN